MSIPLLSLTGSSLLCRPAVCRFSFLSPLLLFFSSPSSVGFPATLFSSTVSRNEVYVQSPANRTHPFQCVLFSDLLCIYFYPTRALYPTLRETYIYTHDARLLASVFSLSILFLPFSNTFLPNQDNKLFLFLRFDTLNDCEFFFLLLRVTLSPRLLCDLLFSIFQYCVQFFLLFVSS